MFKREYGVHIALVLVGFVLLVLYGVLWNPRDGVFLNISLGIGSSLVTASAASLLQALFSRRQRVVEAGARAAGLQSVVREDPEKQTRKAFASAQTRILYSADALPEDFVQKYGDLLREKAGRGVAVNILVSDARVPADLRELAGQGNISVKTTTSSIMGPGVRVLIVDDTLYNFFERGGKKEWVYEYGHNHSEHTLATQYELLWGEGKEVFSPV